MDIPSATIARQPLFMAQPIHLADASHDVRAPGGYEWWYFDAEDAENDRQIVAIFMRGFVFHPGYLRDYQRFLRRPTRIVPPLPEDYVCCYFVMYEKGKLARQFITQFPARDCRASTTETDVSIGANRLHRAADGTLELHLTGTPWELTWRGPRTLAAQSLTGRFTFRPRGLAPMIERRFLSAAMTGAEHRWVVANPLCEVAGSITLTEGRSHEEIHFRGRGYHDHNYGDAPIGPGLKRWIWGRAMFGDRVLTFHHAVPRAAGLLPETHLLDCSRDGIAEVDPPHARLDWAGQSPLLLRYPREIELGSILKLSQPRILDLAPFYMRLIYQAESRDARSTALCEIAYPHRLRWPVLGRMIEMSIDKRACQTR